MAISFSAQNRRNDRLTRGPADIANGIGQLHVHLRQRLLHMLNAARGVPDMLLPLPPKRTHHQSLFVRAERILQQSVGMQSQQPLALLNVGLASGQVLSVRGIYYEHADAPLRQNVVEADPVHARGLQRDRVDPQSHQPVRHFPQVPGETSEALDRMLWI